MHINFEFHLLFTKKATSFERGFLLHIAWQVFDLDILLTKDVLPVVYRNAVEKSRIYGDANKVYSLLEMGYTPKMNIKKITPISVEILWALVKRVYVRIHHHWSKKYITIKKLLDNTMVVRMPYKLLISSKV